jgi:hypothetical protein
MVLLTAPTSIRPVCVGTRKERGAEKENAVILQSEYVIESKEDGELKLSKEITKPIEEMGMKYDEAIENAITNLILASCAVQDMIEACSYGEPELFHSKDIKWHYQNLVDQIDICSTYLNKQKLGWMET